MPPKKRTITPSSNQGRDQPFCKEPVSEGKVRLEKTCADGPRCQSVEVGAPTVEDGKHVLPETNSLDHIESSCRASWDDGGSVAATDRCLLTRAFLVEKLKQQLRELDDGGDSATGQETRDLLRLLDAGSGAANPPESVDWAALFNVDEADDELENTEVQRQLQADIDELSLQLRCNLLTEDRSHVGRVYLNCFVGEDAVSLLTSQGATKQLHILGRGDADGVHMQLQHPPLGDAASVASEVSAVSTSTCSPPASPPPSPPLSPRSCRTNSSAGTSRRRGPGAGAIGQLPLSREEALYVANELVKRGEWQQLTGLEKVTQEREQAAKTKAYTGPLGKTFVVHPALECFTLFRMRTRAALNEAVRWPLRVARNPVALTCHILQLLADLPFAEEAGWGGRGEAAAAVAGDRESVCSFDTDGDGGLLRDERSSTHSVHGSVHGAMREERAWREEAMRHMYERVYDRVLNSPSFRRLQEATAELQAVDLSALRQRALLCFWINIHNILVVHGHCALRTVGVSDTERRMFMKAARYRIGTTYMSLFDVNLILRTRFLRKAKMEPRVHFALSFGSVSSPSIRCYHPDAIHELLDAAAREYCDNVVAIPEERRVTLPVGFKYFAADLAKTRRALVEFVARYAPDAQRRCLRQILESDGKSIDLRYVAPDWQLDLPACLAPLRAFELSP